MLKRTCRHTNLFFSMLPDDKPNFKGRTVIFYGGGGGTIFEILGHFFSKNNLFK